MAEINHLIGIKGALDEVYATVATIEGLRRWWSNDCSGSSEAGKTIRFGFGTHGGPEVRVTELKQNALVRWTCTGHADQWNEWIGTEFTFELREADGQVYLRFTQANWKAVTDTLAYCSTKWAAYLLGLKELIETGSGRPYPNDLQITHR
jgi:hypothetical protein